MYNVTQMKNKKSDIEIRACPHCGGQATLCLDGLQFDQSNREIWVVMCDSCHAEGSSKPSKKQAAGAWNERALAGGERNILDLLGPSLVVLVIVMLSVAFALRNWSGSSTAKDLVCDTDSPLCLLFGAPSDHFQVRHERFICGYSSSTKTPVWVAYVLEKGLIGGYNAGRPKPFADWQVLDAGLASAKPSDYAGSKYDMGHMFPLTDANSDSQAAETMSLANMAPQSPAFNRGLWRETEEYARSLSEKYGRVWVFAGPINSSKGPYIGSGVDVPEAFFKIVAITNGGLKVTALLIPSGATGSFTQHLASVEGVEMVTGMGFFRFITTNVQSKVESKIISR